MKLHFPYSSDRKLRNRGFTLAEMMVAITIFTLLVGGIVFAHLYGLSMFKITETKLNTTEDARRLIGKMSDEIRSCRKALIGNVINTNNFVALIDGQRQEGTALVIYSTTNTTPFVLYFVNPADSTLRRTTSTPGSAVILGEAVTNTMVFRAQSPTGTVLTNDTQNNRVLRIALEFFQRRRFRQVADYYKMETSVTRRYQD